MRKLALLIALAAALGVALFLRSGIGNDVALLNAKATPIHGQPGVFLVTLTIQNDGDAKKLVNIEAPSAASITIMNPGYEEASIVIPAESSGILAADGAHIMLMTTNLDFTEGSFVPLSLTFENYGIVTTRLLNVGTDMAAMNHAGSGGVSEKPSPKLRITAPDGVSEAGFNIKLEVESFSFVRAPDGTQHMPNEGHAHVYLNGLKLGRLYEKNFALGAIPAGKYELKFALNSNNHRQYVNNGEAISQVLSFSIDK
jgi:copper(I)-binding protein